MRVVSLLPSATECVCAVGGEAFLVGRSHECDFPPSIIDRPVLTGAKNPFVNSQQMNDAVVATLSSGEGLYTLDTALLEALAPDVIITQSLCAVCSVDLSLVSKVVASLQLPPKVISLNPFSLQDVLADLQVVGDALGMSDHAAGVVASLQGRVDAVNAFVASQPQLTHRKVGWMEWTEPIFAGGHWTPQLIEMAGGLHPLNPPAPGRGAPASIAVPNEDFASMDPDWVVVCPCGLDIQETLTELRTVVGTDWWRGLRAVKEGRVALVDGNQFFNRPGPRLVDGLEFLAGLLHQRHDIIPHTFAWSMYTAGMEQAVGGKSGSPASPVATPPAAAASSHCADGGLDAKAGELLVTNA